MEHLVGAESYRFGSSLPPHTHSYLWPIVEKIIEGQKPAERRVFDLGCGNGALASHLSETGCEVIGVDPSLDGIKQANEAYPHIKLENGNAYDDLAAKYGLFPVVTSLEVVEHVYAPRQYANTLFSITEPGGVAIVSTPYHGYWKNLALSISGKMDSHFTALWDHGHIKFWSIRTLGILLQEAGFVEIRFYRVGRIPMLAKSMIAEAHRPKFA